MRIRRVHDISDRAIGRKLTADDAELLPPSRLELQSDLDGRCMRKLTNGIALSIGHLELVEVDHA